MTARRLLLALLSLVLLVVLGAAGLLAALALSPGTFKGPLERYASAAAGRQVTIEGPIGLDLGRIATVELAGLRVAAPEWAASPTLAAVRRLRLGLDLGAYLAGDGIVVTELRLDGPEVALERDAQGRTSWPSGEGDGAAPGEQEAADAPAGDGRAGPVLPEIRDLTIDGGRIAYQDALAEVELAGRFATVPPKEGAAPGGRDFGGLSVEGDGRVRGDALTYALEVGSPLLLARGAAGASDGGGPGAPFPIRGRLETAGTRLALDGGAADPLSLAGLTLALDLASRDPTKLLALLGRPVDRAPPDLAVKARLSRPAEAGAAFELADLDAAWGRSRLAGRLAYAPGGAEAEGRRATLEGELRSPFLDLAALEPVLAGGRAPAPAEGGDGGGGDGPGALATTDVRLKLAADRVRLAQPGAPEELRDVAADLTLDGGRLTLDPVRLALPRGRMGGRVATGPLGQGPFAAEVRLDAEALDLAQAAAFAPAAAPLAGTFTGSLAGTLRGADAEALLRESEATLKGQAQGLRWGDLATKAASVEARLSGGRLTLDPLSVATAQGALAGRAELAGLAGPASLAATLDLKADRLGLGQFAALAPALRDLAGAFTGTARGTVLGGSAERFLRESALALEGRFDGLRYAGRVATEAALAARLADGRLTLDPVRLVLPQGRIGGRVATGPLGPDLKGLTGEVDLEAEAVDLAALLGGAGSGGGGGGDLGGALSGRLSGTVRGTAPAEILAQSQLRFAGTVERPRLPQLGDRLGTLGLEAALQPRGDRPLLATATGTLGGTPLRVEVSGRDLPALLADKGAVPFGLSAALGETRASAQGRLTLPLAAAGVDAALSLEGPNPAPVLALFGAPEIELPPYRLAGNLTRRGAAYRLERIDGRVGDSDVGGTLALDLGKARPAISGDLHSRNLDLDDLGGLLGAEPATGAGETASAGQRREAAAEERDRDVLPDDPLDPARWRALDLSVQLAADRVAAGRIPLDGFRLRTVLDDGLLRVDPVTLKLGEGTANGWVQLDARRSPAAAGIDLDLQRLPVARLLNRLNVDTGSFGTLSGRARGGAGLQGRGLSVAQILGTADGEATLVMEGGTLNRELVTALGFDLLRLFGTFLGAAPQEVRLGCAIADLTVEDGLVRTRSLAVETPVADIGGEGTIDLAKETIDLALVADPKGVAVPGGNTGISVTGTLAEPRIALNPALLAARGAAAATLGVFLSPLTGLASQLGVGRDRTGPCSSLVDQLPGRDEGQQPQEQGRGRR